MTVAKWDGLWMDSFRANDDTVMLSYRLPSVCQISGNSGTFVCFELKLYSKTGLARSV